MILKVFSFHCIIKLKNFNCLVKDNKFKTIINTVEQALHKEENVKQE